MRRRETTVLYETMTGLVEGKLNPGQTHLNDNKKKKDR